MNPVLKVIIDEILPMIGKLVLSTVIPKAKRKAFEKMTEGFEDFGEYILSLKSRVKASENTLDDEAYNLSKETYRAFLDKANALYEAM